MLQIPTLDLTTSIAGSSVPALDIVKFITGDLFFVSLVIALALVLVYFFKHRPASLILAVLLTVALIPVVKNAFAEPRPCALHPELAKAACDSDYGFPSAHAALAFILATAALTTRLFWAYLPFAVLVAVLRVYEGVHSVTQVAAGMAWGIAIFLILASVLKKYDLKVEEWIGAKHA